MTKRSSPYLTIKVVDNYATASQLPLGDSIFTASLREERCVLYTPHCLPTVKGLFPKLFVGLDTAAGLSLFAAENLLEGVLKNRSLVRA